MSTAIVVLFQLNERPRKALDFEMSARRFFFCFLRLHEQQMVWIQAFLIIIVGAIPATVMLLFTLVPLLAAVSTLSDQPLSASVIVVWFLLAAIGTAALWLAPFQAIGPKLFSGLLAGVLAICPVAYILIRDLVEEGSGAGNAMFFLIAGPTIVAILLLLSSRRKLPGVNLGSGQLPRNRV